MDFFLCFSTDNENSFMEFSSEGIYAFNINTPPITGCIYSKKKCNTNNSFVGGKKKSQSSSIFIKKSHKI